MRYRYLLLLVALTLAEFGLAVPRATTAATPDLAPNQRRPAPGVPSYPDFTRHEPTATYTVTPTKVRWDPQAEPYEIAL